MLACSRLVDHLPSRLERLAPRLVAPRSPLVHAWGHTPVVLRCGVPTPAGYAADSAQTVEVNGVSWFQEVAGKTVVWTAIRQEANVELRVPTSYQAQGAFLVDLADPIKTAIP
jgi:hypothetical protein